MEENEYKMHGDKMLYKNEILFKAIGLIEKYLILQTGIAILVCNNSTKEHQNVYCYDFQGDFKWQIPPADELHSRNYYTSIYFSGRRELQAYSNNGVEYTLNEENGKIVSKELIK